MADHNEETDIMLAIIYANSPQIDFKSPAGLLGIADQPTITGGGKFLLLVNTLPFPKFLYSIQLLRKMAEDREDLGVLLAVLFTHVDTFDFKHPATLLGVEAIPSLPAHTILQRKFKKIVEASGKYKLEKGKIALKDGTVSTPSTPQKDNESAPASPATGKKRGRPSKAKILATNKKAKKTLTDDEDDEGEAEAVKKDSKAVSGDDEAADEDEE